MNLSLTVRDTRHALVLTALSLVLVITVLVSLTVGAVTIPVGDVIIILLQKNRFVQSTSGGQYA